MQSSTFFLGAIFGSFLSAPRFDFIIGCQTQIVSLSEQESSFTNRKALLMLSFSLRSAFTFSNYLENSQKEHISKIELLILHKRSMLSAFWQHKTSDQLKTPLDVSPE